MSLGLIGKKIGMTKVYTDKGEAIAVTVVDVSGNAVVQVKQSSGKDGYSAVQVGYGEQKESRLNKPQLGHFKKHGTSAKRIVKEFPVTPDAHVPVGQYALNDHHVNILTFMHLSIGTTLSAVHFVPGQYVDVIAKS